jgi:hypothetical protein
LTFGKSTCVSVMMSMYSLAISYCLTISENVEADPYIVDLGEVRLHDRGERVSVMSRKQRESYLTV